MAGAWDRITIDPAVLGGKPCIRGLRIPVALVVQLVAEGLTPEQITQDYPELEPADVRQALEYAAWLTSEETIRVPARHG
ncbi:MAG: DUF433 domain-containing protein [Armatimonadetes bacterium]|nr:DUF433 domain-containing protein [Armatimonadota bacterium]